jgi:hypothetical protein
MSGLNPNFKKELSRRESSMNTLSEFLKYAKIEQDLYDTFEKSRDLSLGSPQHYCNSEHSANSSFTTQINQQKPRYHNRKPDNRLSHSTQSQRSVPPRNSIPETQHRTPMTDRKYVHNHPTQSTIKNEQVQNQPLPHSQFPNCKVCGRKNHRTIDCFYKHTSGCFNCGKNHYVRNCTSPPNFQ